MNESLKPAVQTGCDILERYTVLREYEDFYNTHRPHRPLNQATR
jgi:hypothetical protein